ncbi:MAG: hypothetical protein LWX83_13365 [Anaerolineae bacterium]|nr:hypothetical protein [Anaerolineae bacterium]
MNKRILSTLLIIVVALSLVLSACASSEPTAASAEPAAAAQPAEAAPADGAQEGSMPVFPQLQAIESTDPNAAAMIGPLEEQAKGSGLKYDIKAYVTEATVDDVAAFYNENLSDWDAAPATQDSTGIATTLKYTKPSGETFAIIYVANKPQTNFLAVSMHLWK